MIDDIKNVDYVCIVKGYRYAYGEEKSSFKFHTSLKWILFMVYKHLFWLVIIIHMILLIHEIVAYIMSFIEKK